MASKTVLNTVEQSMIDLKTKHQSKQKKYSELTHLWESCPKKQSKEKENRRKKKKDNIQTQEARQKLNDIKLEASKDALPMVSRNDFFIQSLDHDINKVNSIAIGDSDDESDDDEFTTSNKPIENKHESQKSDDVIPKGEGVMRINRIVSMLASHCTDDRLTALQLLDSVISSICSEMKSTLKPLDFSLPFNMDHVALTHKSTNQLVSDLASDSHMTSNWPHWQKTYATLQSQFLSNEKTIKSNPVGSDFTMTDLNSDQEKVIDLEQKNQTRVQVILDSCGTGLMRCFDHKSEKCRLLAITCLQKLFKTSVNIEKHIPYLMSAIFSRYPSVSYDKEEDIFIHDCEMHEYYMRGGATERQDRERLMNRNNKIQTVESSEEIRLSMCNLISNLITNLILTGAASLLDAYFVEIVLCLQTHLRDQAPDLKIRASKILTQTFRCPQWELGSKHFATALARETIPNLRSRYSKVKIASIELFETSVSVPNRDKVKGAGSSALLDLTGFREENVSVIPSHFYLFAMGICEKIQFPIIMFSIEGATNLSIL